MATSDTALHAFWTDSVLLSNTLIGRDKSIRACQYAARMLSGLTGKELFANLLRTLALSRKVLRFYKPVKAAKAVEDVLNDPSLDRTDRNLTLLEICSDGVYALLDHVAFMQRIGCFPKMSPKQVDNVDRFIEIFWVTEIVPVILRELRSFFLFRAIDVCSKATSPGDRGAKPHSTPSSEELISPLAAYPSSASLASGKGHGEASQQKAADAAAAAAAGPAADVAIRKRRVNVLLLIKGLVCDLPVAMYFLQPAAFKDRRANRAWAGLLGMLASLISLHLNWPKH